MEVEKRSITMEVDTGAAVSLMSEEKHHRRWPDLSLKTAEVHLQTYTGECLQVLGQRKAAVVMISGQHSIHWWWWQVRIPLKVASKFCKARSEPYALHPKVDIIPAGLSGSCACGTWLNKQTWPPPRCKVSPIIHQFLLYDVLEEYKFYMHTNFNSCTTIVY